MPATCPTTPRQGGGVVQTAARRADRLSRLIARLAGAYSHVLQGTPGATSHVLSRQTSTRNKHLTVFSDGLARAGGPGIWSRSFKKGRLPDKWSWVGKTVLAETMTPASTDGDRRRTGKSRPQELSILDWHIVLATYWPPTLRRGRTASNSERNRDRKIPCAFTVVLTDVLLLTTRNDCILTTALWFRSAPCCGDVGPNGNEDLFTADSIRKDTGPSRHTGASSLYLAGTAGYHSGVFLVSPPTVARITLLSTAVLSSSQNWHADSNLSRSAERCLVSVLARLRRGDESWTDGRTTSPEPFASITSAVQNDSRGRHYYLGLAIAAVDLGGRRAMNRTTKRGITYTPCCRLRRPRRAHRDRPPTVQLLSGRLASRGKL